MRRVIALLILIYVLLPIKVQAQPTITLKPHQICLRAWVTGYLPTGSRTASGVWPTFHHTVGVNTHQFHYGTWISIQGLGVYRAEDTGLLGWSQLDVFVATLGEALHTTGWRWACWSTVAPVG